LSDRVLARQGVVLNTASLGGELVVNASIENQASTYTVISGRRDPNASDFVQKTFNGDNWTVNLTDPNKYDLGP
jgi:hypothetical protein